MPVSGPPNITAQDMPAPGKGIIYSELSLSDCRSKSLPLLDDNAREERSYELNSFTGNPPQLSPKLRRANAKKTISHEVPSQSHSLDKLSDHSFYQLAGESANPKDINQQENSDDMYAEVPSELRPHHLLLENTYEQIPESISTTNSKEDALQGNTYETLEDFKPKPSESTWGFKVSAWLWYAYVTDWYMRANIHICIIKFMGDFYWTKYCYRYNKASLISFYVVKLHLFYSWKKGFIDSTFSVNLFI